MNKILTVIACLFVSTAALGCDQVDDVIECAQICEGYDDCVAEDVDVTQCIDECESYADQSSANQEQIELCEECQDAMGCSADCNAQCAGAIPPL